jgi:hypothetical protein
MSVTRYGPPHRATSLLLRGWLILLSCMRSMSAILTSSSCRLAAWSKYPLLASISSLRFATAAWISSRCRSSYLVLATISHTVSLIPWIQLAVLHVEFCSCNISTVYWPNIRCNGDYPVVHVTVILVAQRTLGKWSIHHCLGTSEQALSWDSTSAIGLCPCSISPVEAACCGGMVIFQILYCFRMRLVNCWFSELPSTTRLSGVPNQQFTFS